MILLAIVFELAIGFAIMYRWRWRIGSFEEITSLAATVAITTGALLIWNAAYPQAHIPTGTILGGGAFTFIAAAGLRTVWRVLREYNHSDRPHAQPAIIFGAGEGGRQVIDALTADSAPFVASGLLDDDPQKRALQIRRVRVTGGRSSLKELVRQTDATTLIVAIPSASSETIRELTELGEECGLQVRVLPPVTQMYGQPVSLGDIRPVTEADLLGRHAVDTDVAAIADYLTGKRVMVTGAGGSIGSELCRQLHRFGPSTLIMLDRDESGLQTVQLAIEGRAMLNDRALVVCDIRDTEALSAIFDEHRPEVVFHAAALKHLPLLELWPSEAIKTNVIGTLNLLNLASRSNVQRFVNISSDKAANPTSILGYSKRIGERLTAGTGRQSNGVFLSVRFGNVLGSRGSVLTAFEAQVRNGGPLTVTHPDITRYFMTIEEAVQLTIQAGAVGTDGEVLVLNMGTPVRILDVAQRLASQSDRTIEIVFTGLRPGEKLHEDLFAKDEDERRPVHPLISAAAVPILTSEDLHPLTGSLTQEQVREVMASVASATTDSREANYA